MPNFLKKVITSIKQTKESLSYVFIKKNKSSLLWSTLTTFIGAGTNFAGPYVLGEAVQGFTENNDVDVFGLEINPFTLIGMYGLFWTMSTALANARNFALAPVAANTVEKIALEYYEHIITDISLNEFIKIPPGELLAHVIKCYMSAPNFSSQFWGNLFTALVDMLFAFSAMAYLYDAEVVLTVFATMIIYFGYSFMTKDEVTRLRAIQATKGQECYDAYEKVLEQFLIIKQFGSWPVVSQNLSKIVHESAQADIDGTAIVYKTAIGQSFIVGLGFTGVGLLVASGVQSGKYQVSDLVAILSYLAFFYSSLNSLGNTLTNLIAALTEIQVVLEAKRVVTEVKELPFAPDLPIDNKAARIEFRDVSFSYGKDNEGRDIDVLKNVSFVIEPGQKVGIVGTSGTGKTTIGNLLFRFFDVTGGQISINDRGIETVTKNSLRSAIGIVPQNPTLFNETLYKNIEYGGLSLAKKPTLIDIENAIDAVCMRDVVTNLRNGLHTMLGERGAKLSGGQLQRLAIARCLLKNPKIFIFDEATSALDVNVEHQMQQNIDAVSKGITTIIFTHKFSSLVNADNIFVIDKGRLVEQGTHDQLIVKNGLYAELWRKQQSGMDVPDDEEKVPEPSISTRSMSRVNFLDTHTSVSKFSIFGKLMRPIGDEYKHDVSQLSSVNDHVINILPDDNLGQEGHSLTHHP